MNVLIIGSGGREHALAWKLAQSSLLSRLFIAPGNAGTNSVGTNVDIRPSDFETIGTFALENKIDMLVVGPEDPLVNGIHDYFLASPHLQHIAIIGPQRKGAQLEGSKDFAKQFMVRHRIPTAKYQSFTKEKLPQAVAFLKTLQPPYVLKADGLAAGKGVVILDNLTQCTEELESMFDGKFGHAGATVVIEEFLKGIELSVFVLTDGKSYVLLPEAKDYKRIGEGETGLNTGGMGSVSPVPFAKGKFLKKVEDRIILPTLTGLQKENIPYTGFIFFGLINVDGEPFVIEYNVRLGDPETESVMPRIKSDLLSLFQATVKGELGNFSLEIEDKTCTTIVLVSGGYPGNYQNGKEILHLEKVQDAMVFHAGTKLQDGKILSQGGRVLAVCASGTSIQDSIGKTIENAGKIAFDGMYFRKDIGFDL